MMSNYQKYINNFRIVIASLPDRENCVCEIYYNHIEWAEISLENTEVMIQFYTHPTQDFWEFPLDVALEILSVAKKRFHGEHL